MWGRGEGVWDVLVQGRGLGGETAEGGGDGVELDLLDLETVIVVVDHVVGSEQAEGEVLGREGLAGGRDQAVVVLTWT